MNSQRLPKSQHRVCGSDNSTVEKCGREVVNNNKEEKEVNKVGCGGALECFLSICEKSRALEPFFGAGEVQT